MKPIKKLLNPTWRKKSGKISIIKNIAALSAISFFYYFLNK